MLNNSSWRHNDIFWVIEASAEKGMVITWSPAAVKDFFSKITVLILTVFPLCFDAVAFVPRCIFSHRIIHSGVNRQMFCVCVFTEQPFACCICSVVLKLLVKL